MHRCIAIAITRFVSLLQESRYLLIDALVPDAMHKLVCQCIRNYRADSRAFACKRRNLHCDAHVAAGNKSTWALKISLSFRTSIYFYAHEVAMQTNSRSLVATIMTYVLTPNSEFLNWVNGLKVLLSSLF